LEFDAVVQSAQGGGAQVQLPGDAAEVFATRGRFAVRATFNDVEYRGSTMPTGDGRFCLGLTKAIRAEAGVDVGDAVHVVVERDTSDRDLEVPDELVLALEQAQLTTAFTALAYTHRKEYAQWIAQAKKLETRQRRVAKAVEMISRGAHLS
jgi:hypothetical protein